jgi:hypothetical protein
VKTQRFAGLVKVAVRLQVSIVQAEPSAQSASIEQQSLMGALEHL